MVSLSISGLHDFPELQGMDAIVSIRDPDDERPAEIRDTGSPVFDLIFHDVLEGDEAGGYVSPEMWQLERLLAFLQEVQPQRIHVHCFYGVSRSTAVASFILAALSPALTDRAVVQQVLKVRPQAHPNPGLLTLADDLLGRNLSGAWTK